jgi:hypothetical protein
MILIDRPVFYAESDLPNNYVNNADAAAMNPAIRCDFGANSDYPAIKSRERAVE